VKIHGRKIEGPAEEVVVIPRKNGDIVFKARAILDFSDFDKLCPIPTAPEVIRPGGIRSADPTDREYIKRLDEWAERKTNWMLLKSLEATDGLVFETVKANEPSTWKNFRDELSASGFSQVEQSRLINIAATANGLNESKIEEATKRFLAAQEATQEGVVSQNSVQSSTRSGRPVSG